MNNRKLNLLLYPVSLVGDRWIFTFAGGSVIWEQISLLDEEGQAYFSIDGQSNTLSDTVLKIKAMHRMTSWVKVIP